MRTVIIFDRSMRSMLDVRDACTQHSQISWAERNFCAGVCDENLQAQLKNKNYITAPKIGTASSSVPDDDSLPPLLPWRTSSSRVVASLNAA